ncbi:MAG: zf-HC2 domain-containing protein [Planctomycetales bacterium]|nr:zf-HC2 domain-containing protein [Planctomycetales bacterium]
MNCCHQLDDYLDGELTTAEATEFLRAAAACPACSESLRRDARWNKSLRTAWSQVASEHVMGEPRPTRAGVIEEVWQRTDASEHSSPIGRSTRVGPGVWIAAIVAVGAVVLFSSWIVTSWLEPAAPDVAVEPIEPPEETSPWRTDFTTIESPSDVRVDGDHIGITAIDNDEFTFVIVYPVVSTGATDKQSVH